MAFANVRGVRLHHEILGESGPWMALMQGGRRPLEGIKELATHMASRGYRVLIHDRRNGGSSDVVIAGEESEYEIWAEDLHLLLSQLGADSAIIGGESAGCRTALLFALHHPESCQALLCSG